MFSQNLSSIDGVSIFPIISLVLFFVMFSGVLYWVLKKDKSYMEKLANIPLQDNNEIEFNEESKNEK
jgi:cytochrome c oxidase cbb3-type subunit 4